MTVITGWMRAVSLLVSLTGTVTACAMFAGCGREECAGPTADACGCPEGLLECPASFGPGVCVDLDTDEESCGACGLICGAAETCTDGECVAM